MTTMEMDAKMLAELQGNCQKNGKALNELLAIYDMTELGRKVFDARCDDVRNRVLAEHAFYAAKECARCRVAKGDRIMDEEYTFLLSEEDFGRLQELVRPVMVKEGLTDEEGYFTEQWTDKVCEARCALYEFICKHIMPASIGELFWERRVSIVMQEKVINAVKAAINNQQF